jgi:hypothetical protein
LSTAVGFAAVRSVSAFGGGLRLLRAATMACCAAALAVAAHVLGGGSTPPTGLTLALVVLLAGAGLALARRRRGPLALLMVVGVSQAAMHVVLDHPVAAHHTAGGNGRPLLMGALHIVAALVMAGLVTHAERAVLDMVGALLRDVLRRWFRTSAVPPTDQQTQPARAPASQRIIDLMLRRLCARRGRPLYLH